MPWAILHGVRSSQEDIPSHNEHTYDKTTPAYATDPVTTLLIRCKNMRTKAIVAG